MWVCKCECVRMYVRTYVGVGVATYDLCVPYVCICCYGTHMFVAMAPICLLLWHPYVCCYRIHAYICTYLLFHSATSSASQLYGYNEGRVKGCHFFSYDIRTTLSINIRKCFKQHDQ